MTKVLSITFSPEKNIVQAVISFEHKEKVQHTIVAFDVSKNTIPTNFKKIETAIGFKNACEVAISSKINAIENPEKIDELPERK